MDIKSPSKKKATGDEGYYAPYDVLSPTKHVPSAPLEDMRNSTEQQVKQIEPAVGMAVPVPAPLPPSPMIKRGFVRLTLKLIVYHLLNSALGIGGFVVVVTGVSLAGGLLPLCGLGIIVYFVLLHCVRLMVIMDIALANYITQSEAAIVWNVSDVLESEASPVYQIRIAPKLTKLSWRSTIAIVYFASVKFGLGIISCVAACLPFMPIASEIVSHTASTPDTNIAGYPVHAFNFDKQPVLYLLTCIGYILVGVFLLHFFGRVSREATRRAVCKEIFPTPAQMAV